MGLAEESTMKKLVRNREETNKRPSEKIVGRLKESSAKKQGRFIKKSTDSAKTYKNTVKSPESAKNIVNYLNLIDFSLVNEPAVVGNVYTEILPFIDELLKDPFASTSLEKLIGLSSSTHLLKLLHSIDKKTPMRKLGSRILEKVYERLFECMFKENESFSFVEALYIFCEEEELHETREAHEAVEIHETSENCSQKTRETLKAVILCHNATFVIRKVLQLLSGKTINRLEIEKYQIASQENKKYGEYIFEQIKKVFRHLLIKEKPEKHSTDVFNTLGLFLQITKSQSLIRWLIDNDCDIEGKGYLYEIIATAAKKTNLELLHSKIKGKYMSLATEEATSYFVQAFLRHTSFGKEIYEELANEELDSNSNVIVALVESLQKSGEYKLINEILSKYYIIDKQLFETLLLSRYGTIDTKFVEVVVNFMAMEKKRGYEHFYKVNEDFVNLFEKMWIRSKAGVSLVMGFVSGCAEPDLKRKFVESSVDLFWKCKKWKEGKTFIKKVCEIARGHPRKKAYEILNSFG